MLQILRNSVASVFAKILFGLLVLSFAIWGMGDIFRGGFFGSDTIAEVGNTKISATRLQNEYRQELNRLRAMNIDAEKARQLGVMERLLRSLINRATFDSEVSALGFTASNETVAESIRNNPAFRNELNQFDRLRFEQLLQANGITQPGYEEDLRHDIARNQLLDSLAGNTRIPKAVADTLFGWREEKRIAGVTSVPVDKDAAVPTPTDAQLTEFHKAHSTQFTAPERRAVRFVHISPVAFAKTITVPEEKLKELFEERRAEFGTPEKRKVLQLVTSDESVAKTAAQRILVGEPFADVAKAVSGQSAEGTDLGEITKSDLPEELAQKVFELQEGTLSPPVKGPFGWHIFKVEKIIPRQEATFESVREQLRKEIAAERAVDAVYKKANSLEDAIGSGATLDAAAAGLGLEVHAVAALDRQGRNGKGEKIDDLPGPPFLDTVFGMSTTDSGALTETQAGGYFLARVDSITPSAVQPLDQVRDSVVRSWQHAERVKLAAARVEKIKSALESGTAISEIADAPDKTLKPTQPFTRENGAAQTRLPFQVVDEIFKFKKVGQVSTAFAGDRFVLARLAEIIPADARKDSEGYRALALNLNSSLTSDLLVEFNRALQAKHSVSINDKLLNKLTEANN